MWQRYKKTLIPTQIIILGFCAFMFWKVHIPFIGVFVFFSVMQIGAVLGAAWGARLARKMTAAPRTKLISPIRR